MPLIASAAIGAAGSLGGGLLGSKSSKNAAKQVAGTAANVGNSIQNTSEANFAGQSNNINPYLSAGQTGVEGLQGALSPGGALTQQFSFDPSTIASNPNYQFVLQQGTDAVQKSAAAQGGLFSGGTMKALDQYSQGLATNTINDAYNQALSTFQTNHNNLFSGLTALTNVGSTAIGQEQNAMNSRLAGTEASGQAYLTGANANAAGTAGAGNAWTNALAGITGNAQAAVNPLSASTPNVSPNAPAYSTAGQTYIPPPPQVNPVPLVTPPPVYNYNNATGENY